MRFTTGRRAWAGAIHGPAAPLSRRMPTGLWFASASARAERSRSRPSGVISASELDGPAAGASASLGSRCVRIPLLKQEKKLVALEIPRMKQGLVCLQEGRQRCGELAARSALPSEGVGDPHERGYDGRGRDPPGHGWPEVVEAPDWGIHGRTGLSRRFGAIGAPLHQHDSPGVGDGPRQPFPTMGSLEVSRHELRGIVTHRDLPVDRPLLWHRAPRATGRMRSFGALSGAVGFPRHTPARGPGDGPRCSSPSTSTASRGSRRKAGHGACETSPGPALGVYPPRRKASSTAPASSGSGSAPVNPCCAGSLVPEGRSCHGSNDALPEACVASAHEPAAFAIGILALERRPALRVRAGDV